MSNNSDEMYEKFKDYDFADAKPVAETMPLKRLQAEPTSGKTRITLLLDDAVLAMFRERSERVGRGYQTLINEALQEYLGQGNGHGLDEETLRRVLREELRAVQGAAEKPA
jgi:uncharacterized protein (DUF4415 family)